ncbi:MAG: hypothetical protein HY021_16175 [Burkholderiales bacterium]|nr:hypothetical protein [Burkholderiales bacterium]
MKLPLFFDQVPRLRVQDPLARLLGSADDGILEYSYADAVRLVGHSCPTVASAYWLTLLALEQLYPDSLPQRGGIQVEFREAARSGSTGVVATVVQMLTGAAGGTGFKGIAGHFNRAGLIRYSPDLLPCMRLTRLDTRAAVEADTDLSLVPPDPSVEALLSRCIAGQASADEQRRLAEGWQERVRHLLLDLGRVPGVFVVRPALSAPVYRPGARPRASIGIG